MDKKRSDIVLLRRRDLRGSLAGVTYKMSRQFWAVVQGPANKSQQTQKALAYEDALVHRAAVLASLQELSLSTQGLPVSVFSKTAVERRALRIELKLTVRAIDMIEKYGNVAYLNGSLDTVIDMLEIRRIDLRERLSALSDAGQIAVAA